MDVCEVCGKGPSRWRKLRELTVMRGGRQGSSISAFYCRRHYPKGK